MSDLCVCVCVKYTEADRETEKQHNDKKRYNLSGYTEIILI